MGRSFAYLGMKTVLVKLLSRFIFQLMERSPKMLNLALTLKPVGGLKVKVPRAL